VAGMCGFHFPDVKIFSEPSNQPEKENGVLKMFEIVNNYPEKVTIVATGAQTNLASR
jgi:inosine-uridine nucleoside N-ribohydrolase